MTTALTHTQRDLLIEHVRRGISNLETTAQRFWDIPTVGEIHSKLDESRQLHDLLLAHKRVVATNAPTDPAELAVVTQELNTLCTLLNAHDAAEALTNLRALTTVTQRLLNCPERL